MLYFGKEKWTDCGLPLPLAHTYLDMESWNCTGTATWDLQSQAKETKGSIRGTTLYQFKLGKVLHLPAFSMNSEQKEPRSLPAHLEGEETMGLGSVPEACQAQEANGTQTKILLWFPLPASVRMMVGGQF
jgi:hypothetical protein